MNQNEHDRFEPQKSWLGKFRNAFRGIAIGLSGESSSWPHLIAAAAVVGLAAWLQVSAIEWALLIGCIGLVITTEYLNTAIEKLAQSITDQENELVRNSLDLAAGAVLISSAAAAVVGSCVFIPHLWGA